MTPEQVRKIRRELKLTQTELAKMVGVKRLAVTRWETGVSKISEPIARLLRFLHAEVRGKKIRRKK